MPLSSTTECAAGAAGAAAAEAAADAAGAAAADDAAAGAAAEAAVVDGAAADEAAYTPDVPSFDVLACVADLAADGAAPTVDLALDPATRDAAGAGADTLTADLAPETTVAAAAADDDDALIPDLATDAAGADAATSLDALGPTDPIDIAEDRWEETDFDGNGDAPRLAAVEFCSSSDDDSDTDS